MFGVLSVEAGTVFIYCHFPKNVGHFVSITAYALFQKTIWYQCMPILNPHTDFWGPHRPQNTLIVAPTVELHNKHCKALHIFYIRSYSFWGLLEPANSKNVEGHIILALVHFILEFYILF